MLLGQLAIPTLLLHSLNLIVTWFWENKFLYNWVV